MSIRPRQEPTDLAAAFEQSGQSEGNFQYVQSTDPSNPNLLHLPGSTEPVNLKPVKYDPNTLETPWSKLMRKFKQQPAVPLCTSFPSQFGPFQF